MVQLLQVLEILVDALLEEDIVDDVLCFLDLKGRTLEIGPLVADGLLVRVTYRITDAVCALSSTMWGRHEH